MTTAIFPGSFDPFTLGHKDVLLSAMKLFDKVIIAIGYNSTKKGFLEPSSRVEIVKESIKDLDTSKIEVVTYTGMTINLCKKLDVKYIIRGLRTTTDFELESVIAQANKKMDGDILTIFIPASQEYSFISSTVVRDVLINNGNASVFMAPNIDLTQYLKK